VRELSDLGKHVLALYCNDLYRIDRGLRPYVFVPDESTINQRLLRSIDTFKGVVL